MHVSLGQNYRKASFIQRFHFQKFTKILRDLCYNAHAAFFLVRIDLIEHV